MAEVCLQKSIDHFVEYSTKFEKNEVHARTNFELFAVKGRLLQGYANVDSARTARGPLDGRISGNKWKKFA